MPVTAPKYQIRAFYDAETVTVYQAYAPEIGLIAAMTGRFPSSWKRDRMTWIKPSFLWMMYRCGWGTKIGQETVLAVNITRDGFDWCLAQACLSHYQQGLHPDRASWQRDLKRAPTRVQWDPERDVHLRPLAQRSLQLGLAGEAARRYADEWIVSMTDITAQARKIQRLLQAGEDQAAQQLLPTEQAYPAADLLARLAPAAP